jgi:hypothetical protein
MTGIGRADFMLSFGNGALCFLIVLAGVPFLVAVLIAMLVMIVGIARHLDRRLLYKPASGPPPRHTPRAEAPPAGHWR